MIKITLALASFAAALAAAAPANAAVITIQLLHHVIATILAVSAIVSIRIPATAH